MQITYKAKLAAVLIGLASPLFMVQTAAWAAEVKLQVRDSVAWGPVIVDEDGRSLYVFSLNDAGASLGACEDKCLDKWPPLISDAKPVAGAKVEAKRISTVTRPDGRKQVAYDGWPLFYYYKDEGSDTHGQDMRDSGGPWHMIAPDGKVATKEIIPTPAPAKTEDKKDSDFP